MWLVEQLADPKADPKADPQMESWNLLVSAAGRHAQVLRLECLTSRTDH
jgi:hypothetical protein